MDSHRADGNKVITAVSKKNKARGRNKVLDSGASEECFICKLPGHYGRDCPQKTTTAICHVCQEPGHFASECSLLHAPGLGPAALLCDHSPNFRDGFNIVPECFPRHFVLFCPRKTLRTVQKDDCEQVRLDMLARMLTNAVFIDHGVRHNTVFDIWVNEGVYRLSSNMTPEKLNPGAIPMIKFLERLPHLLEPTSPQEAYAHLLRTEPGAEIKDGQKRPAFAYLDEMAEKDLEDYVSTEISRKRNNSSTPEELNDRWWLGIYLIGDHEGIHAVELDYVREVFSNEISLQPLRLGRTSLFGSACITIVHFLLDKLHICPIKLWAVGSTRTAQDRSLEKNKKRCAFEQSAHHVFLSPETTIDGEKIIGKERREAKRYVVTDLSHSFHHGRIK